ncbi:MAG: hypothetical protein FP827_06675 [Candidatus Omnitrophica bacterium]|nr:hypothetical protein [Candidatus Omnitrophota bacterium]
MNNDIIKVKLNDEQKLQVTAEIETGLQQIQKERDEQNLEHNWEAGQMLYDGTFERKSEIWSGSAQYHINQLLVSVDITTLKAKKQTLEAKPIVILEPSEEGIVPANLRDHEDWLDYRLRKEVEVQNMYSPLYRKATIQGTSILKVPFDNQEEEFDFLKRYKPNDIDKYKLDSLKYEVDEEEFAKNLILLASGQEISTKITESIIRYSAPRPYQVPIEDFYVRPTIKDMYRQKVISEKRVLTWMDIQRKLDAEYYDEEGVEQIKKSKGEKYQEETYTHYETILYSDIEKKGSFRRYVVTIDDDSKAILRIIHFPYWHARIYYIPYYIIPRDDSFYGYGLAERSKESSEMIDRLWNSVYNMADLHQNPPKVVTGKVVIPPDAGPGSLYYAQTGGTLTNLNLTPFSSEHYNLLSLGMRLDEKLSGVSSGMSGGESPADPHAPASKTAMLLSAGNERIDDYIRELQLGNSELAQQVDSLYMQFKPDDRYYFNSGDKQVNTDTRDKKLRYVPHGTEISLNKAFELQMINQFAEFLGLFPDVMQDPAKRNIILSAFIDAIGGSIEKHKKELLPDVNVNPLLQQLSLLPPERLAQMGEIPLSEIMETMSEMMMPQQGQPNG